MKGWGVIVQGLVLVPLAPGVAEAWYPHGPGHWYRAFLRTGFTFDSVVPASPYPV